MASGGEIAFDDALRQRVKTHLAGFAPTALGSDGLHQAAVGVVLLPDGPDRRETGWHPESPVRHACFVLTRRLATLRRHAGQWALPGGRLDVGEDAATAALREIREEIDLDLAPDALLGRLDDLVTRSGHLISPFVVWSPEVTRLRANPTEVDAVFRVPVADLDRVDNPRREPLLHFAFPSVPTTVFAPTAAILYQFREVALHGRHVDIADFEPPEFAWQ